jgi:hypothetical protein
MLSGKKRRFHLIFVKVTNRLAEHIVIKPKIKKNGNPANIKDQDMLCGRRRNHLIFVNEKKAY